MSEPVNTSPTSTPAGETQPERRSFLKWVTALLSALAALAFLVPFVAYLFGPLRKKRDEWITLGPIGDFPVGQTRMVTFVNSIRQPWDGMTANTSVYARRLDEQDHFLVLSVNCAHLGCPVSWFPQSGLFMCPCHGGVYYEDGARASGPPPRGMFRCEVQVRNGQLYIKAPHLPTLQDTLTGDDKGTG